MYDDETREKEIHEGDNDIELQGNPILKAEIENALRHMKNDKTVGNDIIAKEMIEACGEIGIEKVCQLANRIYDKGVIPQRMKESIFITIPEKGDLLQCSNYRLISLMSHVTKIGKQHSTWISIKRGVRQGCVLSPDSFSIYGQVIINKIISEVGFKVNGTPLFNIRYADDTVIIAEDEDSL